MKKYSLLLLTVVMLCIAGCAHDGVYVGSGYSPYYSGFWGGPSVVFFGGGGHHHHHW